MAGTPAVVKHIVGGDDASQRFAREVAGLRLAGQVDPPVVPRLLAADPGTRVLVLEHLVDRRPGDGWQVDYAATLARFHAAGRHAEAGVLPRWSGPTTADVRAFLAFADNLHVSVAPGLASELDELVTRPEPTTAVALLHGDPCADNALHTLDGTRLIDLEQAAFGDGLVELAYLRIGFPTCWCVTALPQRLLDEAEQSYRAAWQAATGDTSSGSLTDACIGWLLRGDALVERANRGTTDHLARIPQADWRWGTVTARERLVYRLDAVATLIADDRPHNQFGSLSAAMRDAMLQRWPGLRPPPPRHP